MEIGKQEQGMTKVKKKIKDCLWKKWLVCVGLMILFGGYYYVSLRCITLQKNLEQDLAHLVKDDFSFVFQVDKVLNEEKEFILDAWAFKLGKEATEGEMEIWLYDLQEEKIVYPKKTQYTKRLDVNKYFLCEYEYTNCGVVASFNKRKLSLSSKDYEVLISDVNNARVYQTGTYICNGELMYCLPEEYIELKVAETYMEEIVNNGILRVYRPDFGLYVYQYDGELYWIAEPDYGFIDEDTYVQFQMDTTQIDKLPADRLANKWYWGNIGFWFKSRELTEKNTGQYRVTKCALPKEYSITKIWTGNHIDDWIWVQNFRPWYDFSE